MSYKLRVNWFSSAGIRGMAIREDNALDMGFD